MHWWVHTPEGSQPIPNPQSWLSVQASPSRSGPPGQQIEVSASSGLGRHALEPPQNTSLDSVRKTPGRHAPPDAGRRQDACLAVGAPDRALGRSLAGVDPRRLVVGAARPPLAGGPVRARQGVRRAVALAGERGLREAMKVGVAVTVLGAGRAGGDGRRADRPEALEPGRRALEIRVWNRMPPRKSRVGCSGGRTRTARCASRLALLPVSPRPAHQGPARPAIHAGRPIGANEPAVVAHAHADEVPFERLPAHLALGTPRVRAGITGAERLM